MPQGSEKSSDKIVVLTKETTEISAYEIATKLNITSRAVEKHISALKRAGVIKRVGPDKGGHWEIVNRK